MDNSEVNVFNFDNLELNGNSGWGGVDPFTQSIQFDSFSHLLPTDDLELQIYPIAQENLLSQTQQQVKQLLIDFLSQADSFSRLQSNFGEYWDIDAAISSLAKIAHGQDFPTVEILPDNLLSSQGAFSETTNTIYLSQQLLETGNSQAIVSVLLEELGHDLDRQLNPNDTPGDEGRLFATVIQGIQLTPLERQSLFHEDDRTFLFLNGETFIVEQSLNDIIGTAGRDIITGTSQGDRIIGGAGADLITGGGGNDLFVYQNIRDAGDTIKDFEIGKDRLDLTLVLQSFGYTGFNPLADSYVKLNTYSAGTVVLLDSDGKGSLTARPYIYLQTIQPNNLTALDFLPNPGTPPEIAANLVNDTGVSSGDRLTFDPTITGQIIYSSPLVSLKAQLKGQSVEILPQLLADGTFTLTTSQLEQINGGSLPDGDYTLKLTAQDNKGNTAPVYNYNFILDRTAPALNLDLDPDFDSAPLGDLKTTFETVTLVGVTEANLSVSLGGVSAIANGLGEFSFSNQSLLLGNNVFNLSATDLAGNQGQFSQTIERLPLAGILLREDSVFAKTYQQTISIPVTSSVLSFTYSDLNFDTTGVNRIKDAFEVALVDADGNSLVHTIKANRDAFFNLTENQSVALASGTMIVGQTVKLNLTGLAPGEATVIFRLVNNDGDTQTSVRIGDLAILPGDGTIPPPVTPDTALATNGQETIDFKELSDVSGSLTPQYQRTSFNEDTQVLYGDLIIRNTGTYLVDAPLIVTIAHLSDPSVQVVGFDGITPEGLPYYNLSDLVADGTLDIGETAQLTTLAFYNPKGVQFTYDLGFLGQLNSAPHFVSEADTEVLVGKPYVYEAKAVDSDGDALTYSLLAAPQGMAIDSATGKITWNPATSALGNYTVSVQVSDGRGGLDVREYVLGAIAPPANRPPVITSIPIVDGRVNTAYEYQAIASDPDGEVLTFSLVQKPEGMNIDDQTGAIAWKPTAAQLGLHEIEVRVQDGQGTIATQTYEIWVQQEKGNHAPVIVSQPVTSGFYNRTYQYDVEALDADSDLLRYSLTQAPSGMTINAETGAIEWIPQPQGGTTITFDEAGLVPGFGPAPFFGGTPKGTSPISTQFADLGVVFSIDSNGVDYVSNPSFVGGTSDGNILAVNTVRSTATTLTATFVDPVTKLSGTIDASTFSVFVSDTNSVPSPRVIVRSYGINGELLEEKGLTSLGSTLQFSQGRIAQIKIFDNGGDGHTLDNFSFGPVTPARANVSIRVEDGRGGSDSQFFQLQAKPVPPAEIRGTIWNDLNGNRIRDLAEPGLSNVTVYLDLNNNSFLDPDEPRQVSVADDPATPAVDETGQYHFTDLQAGSYTVREVMPRGYSQTLPGGDKKGLIGIDFSGNLYNIDLETGRASNPRATGITGNVGTVGLTRAADGRLYTLTTIDVSGQSQNGNSLFSLDSATSQATRIGNTGSQVQAIVEGDLAFDPTTGNLYGLTDIPQRNTNQGASERVLFALNPATGAATPLGSLGRFGDHSAMAFSDSGTLYVLDTWPQDLQNQKLLTVDKANAQILASVTLSQPIGPPNQPNTAGMAFDPETGLLFAGGSTDSLYTIDPATGTVKKVGLTGLPTNVSIAGLTLGSIPMEDYYTVTLAEGAVKDNLNFGNLKGTEQPNRNPSFTSQPPTQLQVGQELRYEAAATDLDNDPLLYDLPVKPIGMAVDEKMGTVVWTPTLDQEGTFDVILRVRDGFGGVALQPFQIVVGATNSGPIITSSPSGQGKAVVGVAYQYHVRAQDDSPEPIQFRLTSAPSGMAIDAATGILTYTPTQVGNPFVSIVAQDSQGRTSSQSFNLNVVATAPNSLPEITSQPRTSIGLGNTYAYQVVTQQADGDRLTYSLAAAPQGMTIDSNGLLLWTPTPDQLGDRPVTVQVADDRGETVQQSFTLAVGSQTTNQAPSIISTPTAAATVNRLYAYDIQVADPNGDPVAFSLRQAPAGMSINPELGTLRWYPTLEQVGEQEVIVDAIDAQGGVTPHQFTLTVRGRNLPPVVTSAPLTQAVLNKPYTYTVQAKDAENQPITFSLVNNPPAGMTIDAKTGKVQWTPTQLGGQAIDILVTDGQGGVNLHSYQLLVLETAPNQLPVIATQPVRTAVVGQPYQYAVIANDADSGDLRFTLQDSPEGMAIDETTGLIQWQPDRAGEFPITVVVTDSNGGKAIQSFTLQSAVNQAPQFASNPVLSVTAGLPYHYDLKVVDPDGNPVTYTLISGPPGMTLDRLGRLTWSPGIAEIGIHAVEIAVTDSYGAAVTQKYDLAVVQDEQKPQVEVSFSSDNVKPGDAVQLLASASDNVGVKALTLLVNGTPVPLDASGGAIFRPTQPGLVQIVATATDAAGNQTSQTKELRVIDPSDVNAPTVAITSPTAGQTFTGLISITGTATDPQGLQFYRLEYARAGTNTFIPFTEGQTPVSKGLLGTLDPSLLANDDYLIRLTARDVNGNTATQQVQVGLSGGAKVGEFRLEFTDLAIPLTGIPIQVNRVYDSRESSRADDFGYGWSLGVQDAHITESVPTDPSEALLGLFVQRPFEKGDRVYLTNPQGERVGFTFDPVPALSFFGTSLWRTRFVADAGVFDTLEDYAVSTSPGPLFIQQAADGTFRLPYFGFGYNPSAYKLTTKDGISYVYDQFKGLQAITDRNDNQLTFSDAGIISSTGQSIQFKRDSQGRIAEIVDPAGQSISYSYDAKGDLISVRDRTDNKTQFTYGTSRPHFLSEVIDPLGRSGIKSEYDDQGRLIRLIDADGNAIELGFNAATSTQTITDALGNPITLVYDERGNVISEIDALGGIKTRTYDENNNLLSETCQLGNTITFTYDSAGNVLTETGPLGNVTISTYNNNSQLLTQTDPLGNTLENIYDNNGNLIRQIDALGNTSNFTYDALGNLTTFTDAKGNTSTFGYDSFGNLTRLEDPTGAVANFTYEANGNLLNQTDFRGNISQFTYDAEGRVVTVTDPDGNVTRVEYNSLGDRVATIDALGRRTELLYNDRGLVIATIFPDNTPGDLSDNPRGLREYDAADQLIALTDEAGRVTRFVYDELGRRIETIFPDDTPDTLDDNPRVRNEYDAAGRVTAEIDDLGNRTEFEYDAARRLVLIRDALGGVTSFTYDENDRLVATTDALGNVTQNQFDVLDRLTQTTDALGNTTSFAYDANDNLVLVTDPLGNITENIYDERDRLIETIDPEGGRTQIGYDTNNNVTSIIDPRGNEVTSEYDARNQLIGETDPLGNTTSFEYDAVGNLIAQTDRNGQRTEFEYDPLNRLVGQVNPLGDEITFTYDLLGNLIAQTDELGRTTSFNYDLRDRLTEIVNPLDGRVQFEYDAAGNLLSAAGELERTTIFTYDALNRQTSITNPLGNTTVIDPLGNVTTTGYDANGNVIAVTDGEGNTTQFEHDALNRQISATDALGNITRKTYDPEGNLLSISDSVGNTTNFAYDALNRLTSETNELGDSRTFAYDAVGNLINSVDRNGRERTFSYDDLDRLVQEQWLNASGNAIENINYTYDAAGQLLTASDSDSSNSFTYDLGGRLTSVDNSGTPGIPEVVLTYSYDAVDNLTSVTDTIDGVAGGVETFTYDDLDRVTSITQNGSNVAEKRVDFTYDAASQLTNLTRYSDLTGSQLVAATDYTYDLAGRLTELAHSQGLTDLATYSLTYDGANRVTQFTSPDGVATYNYDQISQLIGADYNFQGDETYSYDANGNRTISGYAVGDNNQLLSDGTYNYEYDAEGNRARRTEIATGTVTEYTWDYRNRLTQVVTRDSNGNIIQQVEATYDAFDRRTNLTVDADGDGAADTVENFVYDGSNIALVFDEAGNLSDRYLHGAEIDQILASEAADGTVLWALTDNQGTVRDILDADGNIINHITYDSYGNVTSQTNPAIEFRYGYTGRELDEATGLMYYRARYYDPSTGQFISEDPIGFGAEDRNLYRYVFNSPINAIDPTGESALTEYAATLRNSVFSTVGLAGCILGAGSDFVFNSIFNSDEDKFLSAALACAAGGVSAGFGASLSFFNLSLKLRVVFAVLANAGIGFAESLAENLVENQILGKGESFEEQAIDVLIDTASSSLGGFGELVEAGLKSLLKSGTQKLAESTIQKTVKESLENSTKQVTEFVELIAKKLQDAVNLDFLDDIQFGPGGFPSIPPITWKPITWKDWEIFTQQYFEKLSKLGLAGFNEYRLVDIPGKSGVFPDVTIFNEEGQILSIIDAKYYLETPEVKFDLQAQGFIQLLSAQLNGGRGGTLIYSVPSQTSISPNLIEAAKLSGVRVIKWTPGLNPVNLTK